MFIFAAKSINLVSLLNFFALKDKYKGSIGMQCPPIPGPGKNFLNPKGFVSAKSKTSLTLMFIS